MEERHLGDLQHRRGRKLEANSHPPWSSDDLAIGMACAEALTAQCFVDDTFVDVHDVQDQCLCAANHANGVHLGLGHGEGRVSPCEHVLGCPLGDLDEVVVAIQESLQQQQLQRLERGLLELTPEFHDQQVQIHLFHSSVPLGCCRTMCNDANKIQVFTLDVNGEK